MTSGDVTQDAALAAKRAQDSELVALKQQVDRLKNQLTPGASADKKLRKACTDFEAVFIGKIWEQMRATIPKGGIMHSPQEDMYRSMFDKEFSEKLAEDGGFGMGDMLYNQLKDKLKTTTKTLGKLDYGSAAAQAGAPAANVGSMDGVKQQPSALGSSSGTLAPSGTTGSLAPQQQTFKAPKRPMGSTTQSDATSSSTTGSSSSGVTPPAAVPAQVMGEVEALARRIEAAYDARQTQAAQSGQSSQSGQSGQGVRTNTSGQTGGYNRGGTGGSPGSRLAVIG